MKRLLLVLIALCSLTMYAGGKPGKFEVGKNTFLLNGEPFIIKAAEVHYPRIPKEYWEHRIKMCKALGMNSLCLYVFWNLHEQTPGKFDFKGNNDIAAFCKLAQKEGLYVIVRPGPYVCAEWEMGGLPWWLLKKDDVQLRSLDSYYMERVKIFMNAVANELAPLQITNGGNIIMVQVENEFGSYGTDKPYVSAIRDIVRESGFNKVPLFQCDWASNFLNNGLDDLVWTVNFGTGANIERQFQKLKEVRPESPLMCSEFWSGWFDHWGRKHETREGKVMVEGLKEMLERNISFSLYMTHGGTTFGWWGGANNPAYSAMCSSYDYDAPISEAGWTTPKFFELREMMKGFMKPGEEMAEIPQAIPVISIPKFSINKIAPMIENLPKPIISENTQSVEKFDQGWGSVMYRTTFTKDVKAGTILKITEQHDWTQVFVDGKLIARLDRRKGQHETVLPDIKSGSRLDILVEIMGRVNFDKSIHDRKGITEKVELIDANSSETLKNWKIFSFPLDNKFVKSKKFIDFNSQAYAQSKKNDQSIPAYYKGTFTIDKVGDTFLNMETWGKGLVWVNGHCLGRFWEIGPQQTLFMPGCWLKRGENEIVVLDILGPKERVIEGLEKPILDKLTVSVPQTHREKGQKLVLDNEIPVAEGAFKKGNGWQQVDFPLTEGRYFCIEALSSFDGKNVASIAELHIIGEDGNNIPRENWKIKYADSEETRSGNHTADKVYDLQESTYWQTVDNTSYPHLIVIDLGKSYKVKGMKLIPRAELTVPGQIKDYRLFIKKENFKY